MLADPALWKFFWDAAQTASPLVVLFSVAINVVLWGQLKFERTEHRKAENGFTVAVTKIAISMEKIAGAIKRTPSKSRGR